MIVTLSRSHLRHLISTATTDGSHPLVLLPISAPDMASKRSRIPSQDSSSSSTSSLTAPTSKVSRTDRTAATSTHPLLCTLPPTCNHKPTPIANSKDLEIHYAKYHAHVCEQKGCHCVFPDARLLELVCPVYPVLITHKLHPSSTKQNAMTLLLPSVKREGRKSWALVYYQLPNLC